MTVSERTQVTTPGVTFLITSSVFNNVGYNGRASSVSRQHGTRIVLKPTDRFRRDNYNDSESTDASTHTWSNVFNYIFRFQ